jgi:DNA-binding transcriptional MerR regulator
MSATTAAERLTQQEASQPADAAPATDTPERTVRIGEVAERTGVTPRTIRYYEEIGLLGRSAERIQGKHRAYSEADVERIKEIVRLRDLLGLSLEQLSQLLEAESARAHLRREYKKTDSRARRRRILEKSAEHIATQLDLVRGRLAQLTELAGELEAKQAVVQQRIRENS